jgi:hypothetical protein
VPSCSAFTRHLKPFHFRRRPKPYRIPSMVAVECALPAAHESMRVGSNVGNLLFRWTQSRFGKYLMPSVVRIAANPCRVSLGYGLKAANEKS